MQVGVIQSNDELFKDSKFKNLIIAFILFGLVVVINLLTHFIFLEFGYLSMNYVLSASYYGTIIFPIYYVITFIFFFISSFVLQTKAKYFIYFLFILYLIFSLQLINLDNLKFYH